MVKECKGQDALGVGADKSECQRVRGKGRWEDPPTLPSLLLLAATAGGKILISLFKCQGNHRTHVNLLSSFIYL